MSTITIKNLKNIASLTFDMPGPGVHLLCGANGMGKSSLLACLLRLGRSNAFPIFFRSSTVSTQLDRFDSTSITYKTPTNQVEYAYAGLRWIPRPKSNAVVLKKFGYPEVYFVGANASRIEPRQEDFKPSRVREAPKELRTAAAAILASDKFKDLKVINVKRGTGAEAFLLIDDIATISKGRPAYFSEKNFSLGELCVLKLLRDLASSKKGALVLIDELELALHPTAQIRLLSHLESLAAQNGLTIIFSTHSPSLVKTVKQNQILLLTKNASGDVTCTKGAYPVQAIGELALYGESSPDRVIFVEDDAARYCVENLAQELFKTEFAGKPVPTIQVAPVGSFVSVVDFLPRAEAFLPAPTQHHALLDEDVKSETVAEWTRAKNYEYLRKFQKVEKSFGYLPWTPEVGLVKNVVSDQSSFQSELRKFFGDYRLSVSGDWSAALTQQGGQQRRAAKKLVKDLIQTLATSLSVSMESAEKDLYRFFVLREMSDSAVASKVKATLLPVLR